MKLYDFGLSGNAYKVRLLLSFLEVDHQRITVDLAAGEQQRPEFKAINPAGQVPVLVDGDKVVTDSHGILFYLAKTYGGRSATEWLPDAPEEVAKVITAISEVADDINNGLSAARLIKLFGAPLNYELAKERSENHLAKLNRSLEGNRFLLGDKPTLADVAMYPYVKTAADGGIDTTEYAAVTEWMERFEGLPGYINISQ